VGLCVGAVSAGVLWAGEALFGMAVAVGLSMAASVLITGAFHEDGLADTADALGGAVSRERALEIMKDSRIGAYGAIALVLVLGLKAAALASMPLAAAVPALLLAHTASRAAAVALICALPYAGDIEHAKAKPMAQRVERSEVAIAMAWVVLVAAALWWHAPHRASAMLVGLLLGLVGTVSCARWLRRRLGGYTGDALGATQQITELLMLLGWLGMARVI
jgi:adenosylcobinamide-GDP ribazoletransferase